MNIGNPVSASGSYSSHLSSTSELQAALILHTRPYQNSSLLVDFFTQQHGIIRCVAKGARGKRKSIQLSPFCVYKIQYSGKSDLKTLKSAEISIAYSLEKKALLCGLYINELAVRLLYQHDPYPEVFQLMCDTFQCLEAASTLDKDLDELEVALRRFEFSLFAEMGYLVDLRVDYKTGAFISEQNSYSFLPDEGFTLFDNNRLADDKTNQQEGQKKGAPSYLVNGHNMDSRQFTVFGKVITLLAQKKFHELLQDNEYKRQAKQLSRLILSPHLGNKPLQSKRLFEQYPITRKKK